MGAVRASTPSPRCRNEEVNRANRHGRRKNSLTKISNFFTAHQQTHRPPPHRKSDLSEFCEPFINSDWIPVSSRLSARHLVILEPNYRQREYRRLRDPLGKSCNLAIANVIAVVNEIRRVTISTSIGKICDPRNLIAADAVSQRVQLCRCQSSRRRFYLGLLGKGLLGDGRPPSFGPHSR